MTVPNHIKRFDRTQEYYFEEGCHIVEVSNSPADEFLSIVRARVEPGKQTRWHKLLNTHERYVITAGVGIVEIDAEEATTVHPGDVVLIPPNSNQRIHNPGDCDLEFLAICSPRFRKENYRDSETSNER